MTMTERQNRSAEAPQPRWKRGWEALSSAMMELNDRNVGLVAAGVAFWGMFAVFPGIAALISIWGFFADPLVIEQLLQLLSRFLPPEAWRLMDGQIHRLMEANNSTLGWTTAVSIGIALWSSRAGTEALIRGLNTVYRRPNRMGFRQAWVPVTMTLALIGVGFIALATVVVIPVVLQILPDTVSTSKTITAARWGVALLVMIMGLGMIYRYGPNRRGEARGRWLTPGVLVAVAIWAVLSWAFSLYIQNFNRYNEVYGALGAAIILLLWFYISAYAVLLGAALNAKLERMEARRQHKPTPKPGPPVPEDM